MNIKNRITRITHIGLLLKPIIFPFFKGDDKQRGKKGEKRFWVVTLNCIIIIGMEELKYDTIALRALLPLIKKA